MVKCAGHIHIEFGWSGDYLLEVGESVSPAVPTHSNLSIPVEVLLANSTIKINVLAPFTRYNLLSNRFDNRWYRVYKHSIGCQTGLYNHFWQPVERTVAVRSTLLSNRLDVCLHDTASCQTVVQPVVSCKRDNVTGGECLPLGLLPQ